MNISATNGVDMNIQFEKTRVNLWHMGAIFVSVAVNAFALGGVYFSMKYSDEENKKSIDDLKVQTERSISDVKEAQAREVQARVERGKLTDANFKTVFDKMPQFDLINAQILRLTELTAQNTKAIEETNKRIERVTDATANKLDTIISRQAEQSSDIKVIQSQLAEQQRSQRTRFNMLEYPQRPKL